MKLKDKVKRVLEALPLSKLEVEFESDTGYRIIAVVTSKDFEGMDEAERQRIVWAQLMDHLDDREQREIEFVHTMAPSEME
jgi:acid stress-induced BolA-like protein IbaG/YrbA